MPFLFSQFFLFQNTKKIAFRKEFLFQYTIKYHQRKQGSPLILALDVGNTNIVLGCLTEEQVCFTSRLSTDRNKTVSEYAVLIQDICRLYQVHTQQIRGGIISSVVPEISEVLQEAVRHLTGKMPLLVGPDLLPYLAVEMDNPKQLGSDLRVDAIAAIQEYPPPILIIDMGTATTVSVIDAQKRYLGGMIIPGVRLALDALSNQTSQLPHISLDKPERLIGKNTVECMASGSVYGNAAMLDGIIERMEETVGKPLCVVATGGIAQTIIPFCKKKILYDDLLLLKGLRILYQKNETG